MGGPKAPKDPESKRPFFYVMREKEIFGTKQPDGRGIQYIYEDMGRLENSARVAGDITDEEILTLLQDVAGFRKLVHSIGIRVEADDSTQNVEFLFQMYGEKDKLGGGTMLRCPLCTDGAEVRIDLSGQQWSEDDKEPGQMLFVFDKPELLATASVRFFLNDGYQAPEIDEEAEIDYTSEAYQEMIARSLMQMGDTGRVRRAINKAQNGESVTIAYIGGSITQGAGATPINCECYAYKSYRDFVRVCGGGKNIRFVKAGVGGTPSELGMIRFERDVLRDGEETPDIVVVEFAVNDDGDETRGNCYESLVRKILTLPNRPAVILLFSVFANDWNLQDRLGVVGERYQLPMVSVLNAVTPQFRLKQGQGRVLSKNQYFYDMFHPTNAGHTVMADCLTYFFTQAAKQESAAGQDPLEKGLPEPVIGADFERVRLLDKKDMPEGAKVTCGSFGFTDTELQEVEMDENLVCTPEFPYNWMYCGQKAENVGQAFTLELSCKALLLIFKDSGEVRVGRAEVFVDGERKLVADPHINGWLHCNPVILLQEQETKRHEIRIQMAAGDEEKEFTILGFGYV
ncbi:MAG: SGNH/GDSL hydrolase family protein [Lachnospiraceae bacterium]|nr:SGNH/GDSL hydrolase family protein [Lachnospiraceae bacterium]